MATVISILILLVCVFLMLVVLVQNSKGGGLSASFGSSNQMMGVRKTTDFLEKATWTLAIALLCLCLLSAAIGRGDGPTIQNSELEERFNTTQVNPQGLPPENVANPGAIPSTPPNGGETD